MFSWLQGNSPTCSKRSFELSEVQPTSSSQARSESKPESLNTVHSTPSLKVNDSISKLKDYDSYRHFLDQGRDLIEPTNELIDNALQDLDKFKWWNVGDFLDPWGWQQVTIIHLAAHRGRIDILERAVALYGPMCFTIESNETKTNPLLATDKLGRCALHYAASEGHRNVVSWILAQVRPEFSTHPQLSLEDIFGRTPLHDAVGSMHVDVVKLLINAGAEVSIPNKKGVPPYLPAASDEAVRKASDFALHSDDLSRYEKIVNIFLEKKVDVNFQHSMGGLTHGWTMLYYAVYLGSHNAVKRLLENGALQRFPSIVKPGIEDSVLVFAVRFYRNLECIRTLVDHEGNLAEATPALEQDTVFEELLTYIDDAEAVTFLMELLDARVHLTRDEKDCAILNYRILQLSDESQMAFVSLLIKTMRSTDLQTILQHPLLQAYIGEKWLHISQVFYIFLFLYVVFVLALSGYTIELVYNDHDTVWLRYFMLVLAFLFFCYNLQQLAPDRIRRVVSLKWHIGHCENWLMLISLTISMTVAIAGGIISNTSTFWILLALSIANPLAWIQIVVFLGRIPALELLDIRYYALLLVIVLKHIGKVVFVGLLVVVGFSFGFLVLLHKNDQFKNPAKAFLKTIVMSTGEFDYNELFEIPSPSNSSNNISDSTNGTYNIFHSITSRVVFVLFVIVTNIVFMNLTIGIVINDVQALENQGQCNRLLHRSKSIADFERVAKYFGSRSWVFKSVKNWLTNSTKIGHQGRVCEDTEPALWRDVCTVFRRKDRRLKSQMMKSRSGHKSVSLDTIQSALATIESSHQSMMSEIQELIRDRSSDVK